MDLDAYFARIGYAGPRAPTLEVLTTLHGLHPEAIPFENLDPFLNRPVEIEPEAVAAKLVHGRRGGYCFEQNGLFYRALRALGFGVTPLAARVVWMAPEPVGRRPLTHRLTLVDLPQGRFLADVGFGGQSPTAPLRLETGLEQPTPHGHYRLMPLGTDSGLGYALETRLPDRWAPMYQFTTEPQGDADFEMGNWFTSTHPRSHFRHMLIAAKVEGSRRLNLRNRALTIHDSQGSSKETTLADAQALKALLADRFGIALPAPAAELWARVPAA